MFNFLYAYIKLSDIFGYLYICGFNFTLCTLSFYIDLIKLKFGPVENRCVYTDHLHIIFHATHFMMNPCHLVVLGLVIIAGFSCD